MDDYNAITFLLKTSNEALKYDKCIVDFKHQLIAHCNNAVTALSYIENDDQKYRYISDFSDIMFHPCVSYLLVPLVLKMSDEYRQELIEQIASHVETHMSYLSIEELIGELKKGNDSEIEFALKILKDLVSNGIFIKSSLFISDLEEKYSKRFIEVIRLYKNEFQILDVISHLQFQPTKELTESKIDQIIDIIESSIQNPIFKTGAFCHIISLCNEVQISKIVKISQNIPENLNTEHFKSKIMEWETKHSNDKNVDSSFQQMIEQSRNKAQQYNFTREY